MRNSRYIIIASLYILLLPCGVAISAEAPSSESTYTFMQLLEIGGTFMWLILACSIAMVAFIVDRYLDLKEKRYLPKGLDEQVCATVHNQTAEKAIALCKDDASALGRVLAAALERLGTTRQEMEIAVEESCGRLLYDMRRRTRWLHIIFTIAPYLGLLGTVSGMISAFHAYAQQGDGRQEDFSVAISQALFTTAFGLSVALIAYLAFQYFRGLTEYLIRQIEDTSLAVVIRLDRERREARSAILSGRLDRKKETTENATPNANDDPSTQTGGLRAWKKGKGRTSS